LKQTLKIGAMLVAVAVVATAGIAIAQAGDGSSVFSTVADVTAVAQMEVADDTASADDTPLRSRLIEWLAPLVSSGTITDDQAEAVADTLAEHLPRLGHRAVRGLMALDEAADFLGITGRELVEALADGSTLAEIAEANDVDPADLIDHLVGVAEDRLDEAVANGRITEEEKAELLAAATEHIAALVNGELERPLMGGGPGGGPCRDGAGHFDSDESGA